MCLPLSYRLSGKLDNSIADYDVCFCRLMSQLADVNIQSNVGMFTFVIFCILCSYFLFAVNDRAKLRMSAVYALM